MPNACGSYAKSLSRLIHETLVLFLRGMIWLKTLPTIYVKTFLMVLVGIDAAQSLSKLEHDR